MEYKMTLIFTRVASTGSVGSVPYLMYIVVSEIQESSERSFMIIIVISAASMLRSTPIQTGHARLLFS